MDTVDMENGDPSRRLLIDDVRTLSYFGVIARSYDIAEKLLKELEWDEIAFDHDLGDADQTRTGYALLVYLIETLERFPKRIELVTSNPVGRANMRDAIMHSERYYQSPNGIEFTLKEDGQS